MIINDDVSDDVSDDASDYVGASDDANDRWWWRLGHHKVNYLTLLIINYFFNN